MMTPNFGIAELLVSFIVAALGLAFPVGTLYLLFKIYTKVKDIEEKLEQK